MLNLLVGVHIGGDYNPGIDAAQISLDNDSIKHILQLSRQTKPGQLITEFNSIPELGTSDLDTENEPIRNLDEISEIDAHQGVFGSLMGEEGRSEIMTLVVDKTHFWWEGVFKHTDVHWETKQIPLNILPKVLRPTKQSGSTTPKELTPEQRSAIREKIAAGRNAGLTALEIDRTFQRHVTKAHYVEIILELIERK